MVVGNLDLLTILISSNINSPVRISCVNALGAFLGIDEILKGLICGICKEVVNSIL